MTFPLLLVCASFLVLGFLLLSLNLRSAWPWPLKAAAIVVTGTAAVMLFVAVTGMLGWPTEAFPPARFTLHGSLVREPDKGRPEMAFGSGAIFLWLSPPRDADGRPEPPRAFALPYSRELHEQVARAKARLDAGRPVEGRTRRDGHGLLDHRRPVIELFEAPVARLPEKAGG